MTAPLAAFPVVAAPIAAPAAAPLAFYFAFSWVLFCGWGWVCCGAGACCCGAGGDGGGACADAWGTIAVVTPSAITYETIFAERFIWPPFEAPDPQYVPASSLPTIDYDHLAFAVSML